MPANDPMGDAQGTRVGKPANPARPDAKDAKDAKHADNESPHPNHAPDSTGAGAEAVTDPTQHDREHRSGYGGAAGQPVESSDEREAQ